MRHGITDVIKPIPHEDLRRLDVSGACNNLQYGLKHLWEKKHLRSQLRLWVMKGSFVHKICTTFEREI